MVRQRGSELPAAYVLHAKRIEICECGRTGSLLKVNGLKLASEDARESHLPLPAAGRTNVVPELPTITLSKVPKTRDCAGQNILKRLVIHGGWFPP